EQRALHDDERIALHRFGRKGHPPLSPISEILLPGLIVGAGRNADDRMIRLLLVEPATGAAGELPLARHPLGRGRLPRPRKALDEDELGHVRHSSGPKLPANGVGAPDRVAAPLIRNRHGEAGGSHVGRVLSTLGISRGRKLSAACRGRLAMLVESVPAVPHRQPRDGHCQSPRNFSRYPRSRASCTNAIVVWAAFRARSVPSAKASRTSPILAAKRPRRSRIGSRKVLSAVASFCLTSTSPTAPRR